MMNFNKTHYNKRWHYLIIFSAGYALGFMSSYIMNNLPIINSVLNAGWYALTIVIISFIAFESGRHLKK